MAIHGEQPGFQHDPLIIVVPDGPPTQRPRWQERWARRRQDVQVLELGDWDSPHRNTWVNKLNLAIHRAAKPVVLVAHGLGCVAVAWWAEFERPSFGNPVTSGLLVAPPDMDRPGLDGRLGRFGACPRGPLPFPGFLVASGAAPGSSARRLARDWGCRFADAGEAWTDDRAEAGAEAGDWRFGQALLRRLIGEHGAVRRYVSEMAAIPVARPVGISA